MEVTPLTVVLHFLCVARLTHLITSDTILDVPRRWLVGDGTKARGWLHGKAGIVVECPWCASVYVAALVMAALALGLPDWCLAIPAASYVTGWLEMALGAMDDG
jgi:hypothetical protein